MYCVLGGGKTYTMVGTQDQPGIMVRALNQLFTAMEDDIESNHKVNVKPNDIKIPPPPSTLHHQKTGDIYQHPYISNHKKRIQD